MTERTRPAHPPGAASPGGNDRSPAAGAAPDADRSPGPADEAAAGAAGGAGSAGGGAGAGPAVRVAAGVLVALAAVQVALVECFLVPLRIGTVPLPVCVPLAVLGNVALARLAARASGWPAVAVVPPVLWLAVVLLLAAPRAEGDLVVPGTLTGLVFLFGGSVAGAYGAATAITRQRPARPTAG